MPLHTGPKDVSAHDQHAGGAGGFGSAKTLGEDRQGGMVEFDGSIERQEFAECEVVLPLGERLQAEAGAVELRKGHEKSWSLRNAPDAIVRPRDWREPRL
jgi:hypothetical protein